MHGSEIFHDHMASCVWPGTKQSIMAESTWWRRAACPPVSPWEAKKKEAGARDKASFSIHCSDLLLPASATSYSHPAGCKWINRQPLALAEHPEPVASILGTLLP